MVVSSKLIDSPCMQTTCVLASLLCFLHRHPHGPAPVQPSCRCTSLPPSLPALPFPVPTCSYLQDLSSGRTTVHHGVIQKAPGSSPNDPGSFRLVDSFELSGDVGVANGSAGS